MFRAPTLLDGTFCRFFVGSPLTGYCCPLEKLRISACKSHHWVTQHQASSNKKVNIRKQMDCVATKDFAHDYKFVSRYRSKSRGQFPFHRAGFLSRLSCWGFHCCYWMQTKLQSPLPRTSLFLRVSWPPAVLVWLFRVHISTNEVALTWSRTALLCAESHWSAELFLFCSELHSEVFMQCFVNPISPLVQHLCLLASWHFYSGHASHFATC